jgi:hypothetical protein
MFDIQGAASAVVLGWSAKDTTPSLATAPGPLELLPTKHYPPGWLKATTPKGAPAMPPLPVSDPYSEIYSKTTDDCWWGMVDPKLIDPANHMADSLFAYRRSLRLAHSFHEKLDLSAHPHTYGYFGVDEDKHRTFCSVNWEASKPLTSGMSEHIENRKANWSSPLGMVQIPEDSAHKVCFSLSNKRDQGGDGTVPMASGAVLAKLSVKPKVVFKISGFDHQMSYKNMYAYQATIYGVAQLVQLAKPAQP